MIKAGELEISLMANLQRVQNDMKTVKRKVKTSSKKIAQSMFRAKTALKKIGTKRVTKRATKPRRKGRA